LHYPAKPHRLSSLPIPLSTPKLSAAIFCSAKLSSYSVSTLSKPVPNYFAEDKQLKYRRQDHDRQLNLRTTKYKISCFLITKWEEADAWRMSDFGFGFTLCRE